MHSWDLFVFKRVNFFTLGDSIALNCENISVRKRKHSFMDTF